MWGGLRFKCCCFKSFVLVCVEGLSLGAKLRSVLSECTQCRRRWGLQRKREGLRGMWWSKRIEQVREIQSGGLEKWKIKRRGQPGSEGGLVMRRGRVPPKKEESKRDILTVAV